MTPERLSTLREDITRLLSMIAGPGTDPDTVDFVTDRLVKATEDEVKSAVERAEAS